MQRGLLIVVVTALVSGCSEGKCGQGTVRYGDTCVLTDPFDKTPPNLTIDPPLYTRQVGTVTITTDKPAQIYWTIDGSEVTTASASGPDQVVIPNVPDTAQLRTFAVDLAGNQSQEVVRIWIIDRDGPGPPSDFKLALAGTQRTVTWGMPQDPRPGGVLVARVDGRLGDGPVSGQTYNVGDTLSPGVTIVAMNGPDPTGTFSEDRGALQPGMVRYVGWAYDNLYNYGAPAADYQLVPVPPQTARITVNGNGTVTVNTPPPNLTLSGSTTLSGTTLTMKLAMTNNTTRVLFAPKIAVTSTITGATWADSSGTTKAGKPFRSYGAAAVPGKPAIATWTFTGANANTQLVLDLDIEDGRVITTANGFGSQTSAGSLMDEQYGNDVLDLDVGPTGCRSGYLNMTTGGFTPDGRLLLGARNTSAVGIMDLTTGKMVSSYELLPPKSMVQRMIVDRAGATVYALAQTAHPRQAFNRGAAGTQTTLVRLDAATLGEAGRIDLGVSRNRCMDISPDGKTLAVTTGLTQQGVILVDLGTFAIKTSIVPDFRAQCATFQPDGSLVLAGEYVAIYTLDGTKHAEYIVPGSSHGKVVRAALSGTTLWIGRTREVLSMDLTTGTAQELLDATLNPTWSGYTLDVFDGQVYVPAKSGSTGLDVLDNTGTLVTNLPGIGRFNGHWVGRSPF